MKLYYFNPNDWGEQYVVMAEDKTKAYEYLIVNFQNKISNDDLSWGIKLFMDDFKKWEKVNPLDPKTFPDKYTLDEFNVGNVLEFENC
jgi:hypothetical protein